MTWRGTLIEVRTIFAHLSSDRRRELILLILVMPAAAIAETLTVATVIPFIALLSGEPAEPVRAFVDIAYAAGITRALLAAGLLFALVVVLTALLRLALTWLSRHFAFAVGHELSVEVQRRLLGQPYAFHLRRHSSGHIAALDKVDLLVFDLVIQGVQAINAVMIGAFILALLAAIDPLSTALAVVVAAGFCFVGLAATRTRLKRHGAIINAAFEQRTKFVQESIGGIRDIILDHSQNAALDRFRTIDAAFASARTSTAFLAAAPRLMVEAAGLIIIAVLAIVISTRGGGFSSALPFLGALALGAMRLLPLTGQLYAACASLSVVRPALEDLVELLGLPLANDADDPERFTFQRSIEFRSVSFGYPDRIHRAIEDVSLIISKGARVAITGRSGSGKSTLADLIMGLIEPSGGSILVDGSALAPNQLSSWRRSIAHVPQAIFLADDSIAANVALSFHGSALDRRRIEAAANQAQLHEFIESLPKGYDTPVGERGIQLSGGQRQRLALARALYKRAPLLVLDEPTSALDEKTAAAIDAALSQLQAGGTTIVIVAHEPASMAKCDVVYVLDEGRLVRSGSHSELFGEYSGIDPA